jgi:hypothetical protein
VPAPPSGGGQPPSGGGFGSGGGSGSGSRRAGGAANARPILLGVAAVVAVIAAVAAVLTLGGGDDDDPVDTAGIGTTAPATGDETTAPPATEDPGTTASTAPPSNDPFVQIDSVELENGQYLVNFTITGFQPTFDQGGYHSHFYLNDVEAVNAGANGPDPGDWDLTDATGEYLTKYSPDILSQREATQMCSVVADSAHGIAFPGSGNCVDLPPAG